MTSADKNELAAGAPGTVEIGGRVYLVSQPTDAMFLTVKGYVKQRVKTPLQAVAEDLKNLPPSLQVEALRAAAVVQAGGSALTAEAMQDVLLTPDGAAFLAWVHIRPN